MGVLRGTRSLEPPEAFLPLDIGLWTLDIGLLIFLPIFFYLAALAAFAGRGAAGIVLAFFF